MKKILGSLLFGTMILTGCGGNETTTVNDEESKTAAKPLEAEEQIPPATFENGTLETEKYKLTISKAELIQSPMEDNPGLFVTFELTNKTEDEDVVPEDVLMDLAAYQENETSRVELNPNYYFLDAFGDDTETYNKMVDISNASGHALLPGKTVEFSEGYTLNNDTFPVKFHGIDSNTFGVVGSYTVELK